MYWLPDIEHMKQKSEYIKQSGDSRKIDDRIKLICHIRDEQLKSMNKDMLENDYVKRWLFSIEEHINSLQKR